MLARLIPLTVLMLGLWTSFLSAGDTLTQRCLMQPDHIEIRMPGYGFSWLPDEEFSGKCNAVAKRKWIQNSSGSSDLFVYADGPSGSGRYWNLTIGVTDRKRAKPIRGVCMITSTVGRRILQKFKRVPLPWIDDLDNDGRSELIIWSSFPLHEDASLAEYGLVAWVYRLVSRDLLVIDWKLSRQMAREIAEANRSLSDSAMAHSDKLRKEAIEALEQFADERCDMLKRNEQKDRRN